MKVIVRGEKQGTCGFGIGNAGKLVMEGGRVCKLQGGPIVKDLLP